MTPRRLLPFALALICGFATFLVFTDGSDRLGEALFPTRSLSTGGGARPREVALPESTGAPERTAVPETEVSSAERVPSTPRRPAQSVRMEDLAEYRATVPPGRVEGVVLWGDQPLGDVEVNLEAAAGVRGDGAVAGPLAGSQRTAEDGTFAFEEVPAGRYWLRVVGPEGLRREVPCQVRDEVGSARIVLVFGTAAIRGRVVDGRGEPVVDAEVVASALGPWIGGEGRVAVAKSDADGSYSLEGLVAGGWWLEAHHPALPGGRIDDLPQVRLAPGEERTVLIGKAQAGVWSGAVVDADGHPIPGPRPLFLRDAKSGIERRLVTRPDGTFREPLPAGTYDVFVGFVGALELPAGEVSMGSVDVETRLECPTRPVRIEVVGPGDPATWLDELGATARLVDPQGRSWAPELRDGALVFWGLPDPPWTWRLAPGFRASRETVDVVEGAALELVEVP